jgi:hypothetical protein
MLQPCAIFIPPHSITLQFLACHKIFGFISMANAVPSNLKIAMLEQEVARLRQGTAELEARLRKPTLQQHLQEFLKDCPKLNTVEQHQLAGT